MIARIGRTATLAALVLVAAAGCSKSAPPAGTSTQGAQGKPLVFIQEVTGNDFSSSESCGAKAAAKELGYEYSTTGPNVFDATEQIKYVEAVAAKTPAGVLIGPDDGIALRAPMKAMVAQGIKVVELDTTLEDKTVSLSRISSDNVAGGALAAEALSKLLEGKGKVLIVALRPGVTTNDQRIQGFTKWMKDNAPRIEIVATQYDNNDPAKGASIVSAQLSATPDLAAVFGIDLNNVVGAVTGLRQAGATQRVKVVGFDAGPKQVQLLQAGDVEAVISQSPYAMGFEGVKQLHNALTGAPVKDPIATPLAVVTKANLEAPETQKFIYKPTC